MQKWEYAMIFWPLINEKGKGISELDRKNAWKNVELLGLDGWECFAVTSDARSRLAGDNLYFKRPIED